MSLSTPQAVSYNATSETENEPFYTASLQVFDVLYSSFGRTESLGVLKLRTN